MNTECICLLIDWIESSVLSLPVSGVRKEGNALFNDILDTFYGVGHMVKSYSYSERGNPLLPVHGLHFLISSKGYFICTIPQAGYHIPWPLLEQLWSTGSNDDNV